MPPSPGLPAVNLQHARSVEKLIAALKAPGDLPPSGSVDDLLLMQSPRIPATRPVLDSSAVPSNAQPVTVAESKVEELQPLQGGSLSLDTLNKPSDSPLPKLNDLPSIAPVINAAQNPTDSSSAPDVQPSDSEPSSTARPRVSSPGPSSAPPVSPFLAAQPETERISNSPAKERKGVLQSLQKTSTDRDALPDLTAPRPAILNPFAAAQPSPPDHDAETEVSPDAHTAGFADSTSPTPFGTASFQVLQSYPRDAHLRYARQRNPHLCCIVVFRSLVFLASKQLRLYIQAKELDQA